ncbi:MAG: hypothetical protein DWI23_06570 [Planctomycetota bacterium]|nr:MAG: hypothetical protein DWI23_06570 [Planctomycetota bacterium]
MRLDTEGQLFDVVGTRGSATALAGRLYRWKQQGNECADDCDHDEQLNQREATSMKASSTRPRTTLTDRRDHSCFQNNSLFPCRNRLPNFAICFLSLGLAIIDYSEKEGQADELMTPRRFCFIAAPLAAGLLAVAALAFNRPICRHVDGLSMAPGLLPGDRVTMQPAGMFARARQPRRLERWVLDAPESSPAVKRVVGLGAKMGGEQLSIQEGDLVVDGATVLAPPRVLAQTASPVAAEKRYAADGTIELVVQSPIYDDASFAPDERRLLLPVRDVGVAAVIRVPATATRQSPARVVIRIENRGIAWTVIGPVRLGMVAGRLDGNLVGAAWPVAAQMPAHGPRTTLPPGPPLHWSINSPWPDAASKETPSLSVRVEHAANRSASAAHALAFEETAVEELVVWRDILYRPAANGTTHWLIGPDQIFVLGDFPSGSRDSRHWGPLDVRLLLHCLDEVIVGDHR